MEDKIFYLCSVVLGLLILQHALLFFIITKINSTNKKLIKQIENFITTQQTASADLSEVMAKFMQYLEKEFSVNFENQKKQQEWFERNLEAISTNVLKSNNGIEQTQRFLGRMSEALGIVQRSNLQDV